MCRCLCDGEVVVVAAVEPRSSWSNRAMSVPVRSATPYKGVAVHWPGEHASLIGLGRQGTAAAMRSIEAYQMDHAGYGAIAYQCVATWDGRLIEGRTKGRVNGANGDTSSNTQYGSVLALLGIGEKPTPAMLDAIRRAPAYLNTPLRLFTHNQVRPEPTACPGPDLTAWIKAGYPAQEEDVAAKDVWDYVLEDKVTGEKKSAEKVVIQTKRKVDAILALISAQQSGDQATIEAALKKVLGSLDDQ